MILDRFGRDQHELLVRQLLRIKQPGTVVEYIEKFAGLIDQLAAYEGVGNTLHYTMRFIDGLKDELKGAILIQRPKELDATYVLAQLQEELVDSTRKKDYRKSEYPSKSYFKQLNTSPCAPPRQFKPSMFPTEDRRSSEAAKASSADDKWRSLKAFRRAKGLCQYCAEKWTKEHKCADNVQVHVVQELMIILQPEEDSNDVGEDDQDASEQIYLTLSCATVSGLPAPKTLCLSGTIQDHAIKILVDSGSSHSFIAASLAS
jgi:hypothetical protein